MLKKEILLFSAIILLGLLDWATTTSGILFCGATETNPLLSGLTKSSTILFDAVKLSAVAIVGLAFYKALAISKSSTKNWQNTKSFLYGGYSLTFLVLTVTVAINMIAIFKV
jgi:hypothetical protein